ncbi:MAG: molybdenum cofactor guanylyltransferase MobA [Rhodospirillales bacterium]|nr:molybdenum cofactor guanylyltransferase MobA [Rhodospirillales bacterium]
MNADINVVGVLLAGGLSRRMGGGDKNLLQLAGQSILSRTIARVTPQVSTLILNANGDAGRFASYGLPVVGDVIDGFAGPLAGILTGLEWASANRPDCQWIATFPTDAPFLPENLVAKLMQAVAAEGADMACATSNNRTHPPIAVWPVRLKNELRQAMVDEDMRKIDLWTGRYSTAHVAFDDPDMDPFFNINRPENLDEAERYLAQSGSGN